jgi:hypothetical protein
MSNQQSSTEFDAASTSPGYIATFHLPDGSRLVVAVAGAVGCSCGGDRGPTRLVLRGPDRRVRVRGDLRGLLRRAGLG